jgi:DNA-binding FadR family transcriptional regulator
MIGSAFPNIKLVRPPRLYEQIAAQIEAMIRSEQLPEGAKLPGERELAERLGVSRPSLREALIALETAGLVEVRAGGGTFVRPSRLPRLVSFADGVDLGPGPLEQFEARRCIETTCAELAARRAGDDEIDELDTALARIRTKIEAGENPADEHQAFHLRLADAAHNSILANAVRELWRLRREAMWDLLRVRVENPESWRIGLESRAQLLNCLRRRDVPGAREVMAAHFDRLELLYFDPGG